MTGKCWLDNKQASFCEITYNAGSGLRENEVEPFAVSRKTVLLVIAIFFAATTFLLAAYLFQNQPVCPRCENSFNVVFTWRAYHDSNVSRHMFYRFGPFGRCDHYDPMIPEIIPAPQFSWYCATCSKHVRRGSNWRQK